VIQVNYLILLEYQSIRMIRMINIILIQLFFQNHLGLTSNGYPSVKFDIIVNNYKFIDPSSFLVLVYLFTDLDDNITVVDKLENGNLLLGNAIFTISNNAISRGDGANVPVEVIVNGISTNSSSKRSIEDSIDGEDDGTMYGVWIIYKYHFIDTLEHDPEFFLEELNNDNVKEINGASTIAIPIKSNGACLYINFLFLLLLISFFG